MSDVDAEGSQLPLQTVGDRCSQGHVAGQDPRELEAGQPQDGLTGVDQGVGLVVGVHHPVGRVRRAYQTVRTRLTAWSQIKDYHCL